MSKVIVLYQITNVKDSGESYNAFELPRTTGTITLTDVKNHCHALNRLNVSGSSGYHWRVRVDDKQSDPKAPVKYSWWDIQDESARLPVKEVSSYEVSRMLSAPSGHSIHMLDESKSGVMGSIGKAMNKVALSVESSSQAHHDMGPKVPIIVFKLLDMTKVYDDFAGRASNSVRYIPRRAPAAATRQTSTPSRPSSSQPQYQRQATAPATTQPTSVAEVRTRGSSSAPPRAPPPAPHVQEATLVDFGSAPTPTPVIHRSETSVSATGRAPNETRAQQLKREYEEKSKKENRVWDDVDQRWVSVDASATTSQHSTVSAPPGADVEVNRSTLKGVSLDNINLEGKSREVAAAVQERVADMKNAQQKALDEMREREEAKKKAENEEDIVRQKLEPKIKAWSEEHGKKKQLRALLANLHTILWPGANWKPVGLGDLLDDKKVKLTFHKASRVVHPDKTMSLGPEERFLAKRIFDALSQAKAELDSK